MEVTLEMLEAKVSQFKELVASLKSVEPKVDTSKLEETFDETETKVVENLRNAVNKAWTLFEKNQNVGIAIVVNEAIKTLAADAKVWTNHLQSVSDQKRAIVLDDDRKEGIEKATKMRNQLRALQMLLEADDVKIPAKLLKENGKTLDLPNIPGSPDDEKESTGTRGRPAKEKILILGIVKPSVTEDGEPDIQWFDNDNVGKTFVEVFGSVRKSHNFPDLCDAVKKSEQSATAGWSKPVEYAGYLWVAKQREKETKK